MDWMESGAIEIKHRGRCPTFRPKQTKNNQIKNGPKKPVSKNDFQLVALCFLLHSSTVSIFFVLWISYCNRFPLLLCSPSSLPRCDNSVDLGLHHIYLVGVLDVTYIRQESKRKEMKRRIKSCKTTGRDIIHSYTRSKGIETDVKLRIATANDRCGSISVWLFAYS